MLQKNNNTPNNQAKKENLIRIGNNNICPFHADIHQLIRIL
jgi:hypothetical protein